MGDAQQAAWIKIQNQVAECVAVLPDDIVYEKQNGWKKVYLEEDESGSLFGGVDVSFPDDANEESVAVYVILRVVKDAKGVLSTDVVYKDWEHTKLTVPYIPSFLAFREIESLERLVRKQQRERPALDPKAIFVDGNGILHPRFAGIASFLGTRTDVPTIGVGKTLFCDGGLTREFVDNEIDTRLDHASHEEDRSKQETHEHPYILFDRVPIFQKGNAAEKQAGEPCIDRKTALAAYHPEKCHGIAFPLQFVFDTQKKTVGCALLYHGGASMKKGGNKGPGTKNQIYISVGHNISLQRATALAVALSLVRIPEPVRQADLLGREIMRIARSSKCYPERNCN